MLISGDKESLLGLEVLLESGLLPVAWKSLDGVSCNASYDRWGDSMRTTICQREGEPSTFSNNRENTE